MRRFGVAMSLVLVALAMSGRSAGAEPLGSASRFVPVSPTRILDTRSGLGAPPSKVNPNASIDLQLTGVADIPSSGVTAVMLNVTATQATAPGYIQVFPTGQAAIGASSNLNVEYVDQTIPNLVVVPVGIGGKVTLYTQGGAHLLADLFGYFVESGSTAAGRYVAATPTRLLDTRSGLGPVFANPGDILSCSNFATWAAANRYFWTFYERFGDVAKLDANNDQIPCETLYSNSGSPPAGKPVDLFKLAAGNSIRVMIRGAGPVPAAGVSAVVLNVTATAAAPGYVQVIPTGGATAIGASSNLNISKPNDTIANLVTVPVGADGTVTLYVENGTHLLADVAGYFTDGTVTASSDGLFIPLRPERLLDTRSGVGAPATKIGAGGSVTVNVRGVAGVPAGASAAFLNVTATQATDPGFVQVFPTGQAAPGSSSNLNVTAADQTIANAVFATLSTTAGQVTIYSQSGTHALADAAGYFTAPP